MTRRVDKTTFLAALIAILPAQFAIAAPDVVVLYLASSGGSDINEYGPVTVDSVDWMAYAWGTTSCNRGDTPLDWYDTGALDDRHPVIAQNMYRLKDGQFEQIGLAWLKHGFCAVNENGCGTCQNTNCDTLGVQCADTYWAGLNDNGLKPRWPVNATTGVFPYPESQNPTGISALRGRVQVRKSDINPAENSGADYFIEGHYVTQDDAAAGAWLNNASWRRINNNDINSLSSIGGTQEGDPAVFAWQVEDASVTLIKGSVPSDGVYWLAYKVSDNGDGTWHYEYALFNMNSHRCGRSFAVPIPAGVNVTNIDFHDVDYHSGEPNEPVGDPSSNDWDATLDGGMLTWQTDTYTAANEHSANALRWSTLYNFRFDANTPPTNRGGVIVGLFRPGSPDAIEIAAEVPQAPVGCPGLSGGAACPQADINGDNMVNGVDLAEIANSTNFGRAATAAANPCTDVNGDGTVNGLDYAVAASSSCFGQ